MEVDLDRSAPPTAEEVARAKKALEERRQRQERAYVLATHLARSDPLVLQALDDAFARLGLLDPDRHFRLAIARYDRDTVADSIAIFEAKMNLGTLPENAGPSYLLGMAKNRAQSTKPTPSRSRSSKSDSSFEIAGSLTSTNSEAQRSLYTESQQPGFENSSTAHSPPSA